MAIEALDWLADTFKYPTRTGTEYILSGDLCSEKADGDDIISRISRIAKTAFAAAIALLSIPLWFIGEGIEILSGRSNRIYEKDADIPNTPLSKLSLDPNKTELLNIPISTYQNSADRNFCKNSDWGKYSKELFNEAKGTEHLGPWHGVDILTDEGLEMICQKSLEIGANSVRFSVEWADIEKTKGQFDDVAMQRYVHVAKKIKEKGLEPIVVLHHFVTPLDEKGRNVFESSESIDRFVNFSSYAYENLKEHVSYFFTFNEPNVQAMGNYVLGMFPMKQIARFDLYQRVMKNMLLAHKKVYHKLQELSGDKKITVGLTYSATCFVPSSRWNLLARITAFVMTHLFHDTIMKWALKNSETVKYLGMQYYSRVYIDGWIPTSTCRKGERMVDAMQYRYDPKGLLPVLREINSKLQGKVKLFVSETGFAGENSVDAPNKTDDLREEYFTGIGQCIRQAQDEGIPVIGLGPWNLYPPAELEKGYAKAADFGNIARDPVTKKTRDTKGFTAIQTIFKNTMVQISKQKKAS